ncbi:MAG: hypothetical protein LAP85_28415 [Acidobacteriia bacterium]|nr:hypothetical protein [Terriglobia bacterium]
MKRPRGVLSRAAIDQRPLLSGTVGQAEKLLFMAKSGYDFAVNTDLGVKDAQMNLMAAPGSLARAQRDNRVAWLNPDSSTRRVP